MINLNGVKPFARGGNRACYRHPDIGNLCLKITHPGLPKKLKRKAPWYKKLRTEKSFDDNVRERIAYEQNAITLREEKIWDHLAKWYGLEQTSLGIASVTELILNNEVIADTLETYLIQHGMTKQISGAINDFENRLRETLLLTKNILPHNVVVKEKDGKLILKIVDGLGCSSFLPLAKMNNFFAKRYVERRIILLHKRIEWDLSGKKGKWK